MSTPDWPYSLAVDVHDDPTDHEHLAALREQDDELRADIARDDQGWPW